MTPMTYAPMIAALDAKVYNRSRDFDDCQIDHVVAGDLMSDILTMELDHLVIITSLATDQVVRTADFVGAKGVILANGKKPSESLLNLARESDISVLATNYRMFETCVRLGKISVEK